VDRLTRVRAEEILFRGRDARVLVVGDLMLDRYLTGSVDRVSPEAPVPVVLVEEESLAVGGAANVAANVAALGAPCRLVGCLGQDASGEALRAALTSLGVRTEGLVTTDERPTTVKTRILARRQQVARVDREVESDVSPDVATALAGKIRALVGEADVLVLEDYNKGVLVPAVVETAMEAAAERGIPVVVDPKRRNFFLYGGATVFKPNAKELADALGDFLHPDDPDWLETTRRRMGCENLLLTLGEAGMALQTAAGASVRIPTVARSVYDVSGAGDTVTATVAVALGGGGGVAEAAALANHAAAVEVGKAGVATVSPKEILEHVTAEPGEPTRTPSPETRNE
jgi:D-beta-D-heptose 7-phosphate kinase/D-beta-D-heptose 1-phosphate adenosyltransferase